MKSARWLKLQVTVSFHSIRHVLMRFFVLMNHPCADGIHLALMQHTLHIAFMPFLDPQNPIITHSTPHTPINRSYSFFSLPTTPHTQYSPPLPSGHGIFSKTHPATSESSTAKWPLQSLVSGLNPRNIAKTLTTVHLKLHTTLVFNEHGKIIVHEDTWGLKEIVEGVFPIIGTLYALHRQGMAFLGGIASRMLLGKSSGSDEESKGSRGGDGSGSNFHGSSLKYGIGSDGKYVDFSLLDHPGPRGGSLASASDEHPQAGMATPDPPSLDLEHDDDEAEDHLARTGLSSDFPAGSPMSTRRSSLSGPGGIWMNRERPSRPTMKEAQVQTHSTQAHGHVQAHAHAHFDVPSGTTKADGAPRLGSGLELDTAELTRELQRKAMGGEADRLSKQRQELAREREKESAVTTTTVMED